MKRPLTPKLRVPGPAAPSANAMATAIASLPRVAPPTGCWPYRGHRTVAELDAADDEALGEAIARAEVAEGKLAQLRAALA